MFNFRNREDYKSFTDKKQYKKYYYECPTECYFTFAVRCCAPVTSKFLDEEFAQEHAWLADVTIINRFIVARAVADAFSKATGWNAYVFDRGENVLYVAEGQSQEDDN